MEERWVAWVAGLFEGEGCIVMQSAPQLSITSTDEDVIRRLYSIVQRGVVYGPYQPSRGGRKPWWRWSLYGWENTQWFYDHFGFYLLSRRSARLKSVLHRRPEPRATSPRCGQDPHEATQRGWARHHRKNEPPCVDCNSAKALYLKRYRESRNR